MRTATTSRPLRASGARLALALALVGGPLCALTSGCAWFTTPVGQPLPGEKAAAAPAAPAAPAPGAPAAAPVEPAPVPAAPAAAPGAPIVHPPTIAVPALLDILRQQGRARGAQGNCYVVAGRIPGLTPVAAGAASAWGSFGCDPAAINKLILGRALYLEGWWVWPNRPNSQANLHFYGAPGTAFLGRPGFAAGPQGTILDEILSFRAVPAHARLVIFFNAGGAGPAPAAGAGPAGTEAAAGGPPPGSPAAPAAHKGPAVDEAQTLALLKSARPTMDRCFQSAGKPPQGVLSLDVKIDGEGKVAEVKILSSDLTPEILEDCISGVVRTLTFPRPLAGAPVDLSLPLVFSAPSQR